MFFDLKHDQEFKRYDYQNFGRFEQFEYFSRKSREKRNIQENAQVHSCNCDSFQKTFDFYSFPENEIFEKLPNQTKMNFEKIQF